MPRFKVGDIIKHTSCISNCSAVGQCFEITQLVLGGAVYAEGRGGTPIIFPANSIELASIEEAAAWKI